MRKNWPKLFPRKVRVTADVSYDIFFVDKIDEHESLGFCDSDKKQILILLGMSDRETLKTIVHEVLHAIEFENDIPLPHSVVYALDEAIERVLRLNKWA